MRFLKFPIDAMVTKLTPTDTTIFLQLLLQHFNYCRNDYKKQFYITDRDLAQVTGCSLRSIWLAKKRLSLYGLIKYDIGFKNKTYYKILSLNGNSHS